MPAWLPILAIAGVLLGILLVVWKFVANAQQKQKEATEGQARAGAAESTLKDAFTAKAIENEAKVAGDKAAKEANEKRNPFDFN